MVRIFGEPRRYALDEPLRMTIAVAGTVLISYPGAWAAGAKFKRPSLDASSHRPGGTGWDEVFLKRRPSKVTLWVTVVLRSGERISGEVTGWSSSSHDNRELVLMGPLVAGTPPRLMGDQFVVLREQDIEHIAGRYLSEHDGSPVAPRHPTV